MMSSDTKTSLSFTQASEILESITDAFYAVDSAWRLTYVNRRAESWWQRSRETLVGNVLWEIFPGYEKNEGAQHLIKVMKERTPGKFETFSPVLGTWVEVNVYPASDGGLSVYFQDVTARKRSEEVLREREVHHRLIEQREKERQSLARDIHDGPVQTLSSITFAIQFLKEAYPDPTLRLELDQIGLNVKTAVQELRQMINELRPPAIIRFGLTKAIRMHAEDLQERCPQIEWSLKLTEDGQHLPELVCLALFRIYQEAVNNVVLHSAASKVWVVCRLKKDWVTLEIRDNGRGFAEKLDISNFTKNQHFGLAGIKERVEAIGGQLHIETGPGKGTKLSVRVPVPGNNN
jgi:PAS domain S-box-containing protein